MTAVACIPLTPLASIAERERRPDRFGELLVCMSDLLFELRRQQVAIVQYRDSNDPRVREAIASLAEIAPSLEAIAVEASSVHQELQHVHLI